jgi:hypothetical protein
MRVRTRVANSSHCNARHRHDRFCEQEHALLNAPSWALGQAALDLRAVLAILVGLIPVRFDAHLVRLLIERLFFASRNSAAT